MTIRIGTRIKNNITGEVGQVVSLNAWDQDEHPAYYVEVVVPGKRVHIHRIWAVDEVTEMEP
jgi:hypothetical protein